MSVSELEICSLSIAGTLYSAISVLKYCASGILKSVPANHASSSFPSRVIRANEQAASAIQLKISRAIIPSASIGATLNDRVLFINVVVTLSTPTKLHKAEYIPPNVIGYVNPAKSAEASTSNFFILSYAVSTEIRFVLRFFGVSILNTPSFANSYISTVPYSL